MNGLTPSAPRHSEPKRTPVGRQLDRECDERAALSLERGPLRRRLQGFGRQSERVAVRQLLLFLNGREELLGCLLVSGSLLLRQFRRELFYATSWRPCAGRGRAAVGRVVIGWSRIAGCAISRRPDVRPEPDVLEPRSEMGQYRPSLRSELRPTGRGVGPICPHGSRRIGVGWHVAPGSGFARTPQGRGRRAHRPPPITSLI